MRFLLIPVLLLASCSLIPFSSGGSDVGKQETTTTQTLVEALPEAVNALSGLVETLIITGIIASLMFRSVRLAVAAMLVAFYNRIESWFRGSSQPPSS